MPSARVPSAPAQTCGSSSASQAYFVPVKYGSSRRPVNTEAPVGPQPVADPGGPPVLPDDRRAGRAQRAPVPDDRGLPLVGDPDAGRLRLGAGQRLAAGGDGRRPDVVGLVLHPPGAGEQLRELAVATGRTPPSSPTTSAVTPVVPASMASTGMRGNLTPPYRDRV